MELKELLLESIQDRFFAHVKIKAIEKKIETDLDKKLFEKYKNTSYFKDGMNFKLIKVSSHLGNWSSSSLEINKVGVRLFFITTSKLPKKKRERLDKSVEHLNKHGSFEWNNFKVPIWETLCYNLELDQVLEDKISLEIG